MIGKQGKLTGVVPEFFASKLCRYVFRKLIFVPHALSKNVLAYSNVHPLLVYVS